MENRLDFRFEVLRPPAGPVVELSATEAERLLLKKLAEAGKDTPQALWQLARFYQQSNQIEKGLACLRQVVDRTPDAESKANCALAIGQMMESAQDYDAAVRYYKEALALEPVQTDAWYFINNNLGFSLNILSRFAEGETYCRKAIEVDPKRPNAHKNLGIALAGQGQYSDAARCFVAATQGNAADARALRLLKDLIKLHPELGYDFGDAVEMCEKAVEVAAKRAEKLRPVVHRGWRKQVILLRARLLPIAKRLRNFFY